MNQDDIIRLAQTVALNFVDGNHEAATDDLVKFFAAAYNTGKAYEREECAKLCENATGESKTMALIGVGFAELIRKRGET